MADKIRVLLSEEEVNTRISQVAAQISKDYEGKAVHLICILKGGVFFTCELAKRLTVPVSLDFMSVSSYGDDTKSSGVVRIVKDLDEPLTDLHVLIVEDIIDSGRTLSYLMEVLKQRNQKGLYQSGSDVAGVDLEAELPGNPDLVLKNDGRLPPQAAAGRIWEAFCAGGGGVDD